MQLGRVFGFPARNESSESFCKNNANLLTKNNFVYVIIFIVRKCQKRAYAAASGLDV